MLRPQQGQNISALSEEILSNFCFKCIEASVYSGAQNHLQINQWPRFCGLKFNRHAHMLCLPANNHQNKSSEHHVVQWYKVNKYDDALDGAKEIKQDGRIKMVNINVIRDAKLHIHNLTLEDTGVYFCRMNNTWGPGTELQVASKMSGQQIHILNSANF